MDVNRHRSCNTTTNRVLYFATDVMRSFTNKYNIHCTPREARNAMSPFTHHGSSYGRLYPGIGHYRNIAISDDHGYPLGKDIRRFIQCYINPPFLNTGKEAPFRSWAIIERYATVFYMKGVRDAPNVAFQIIESMLHKAELFYHTDIFVIFHQYSTNLLTSPCSECTQILTEMPDRDWKSLI